jgi:hypothetical protein
MLELMRTKSGRRSDPPAAVTPVMVMPKQTHDEIERRQQIRESLHDATAVTVRARRSPRRSRSSANRSR